MNRRRKNYNNNYYNGNYNYSQYDNYDSYYYNNNNYNNYNNYNTNYNDKYKKSYYNSKNYQPNRTQELKEVEISSTKPIKNQTVTSQFSEKNQIENKVEKTEEQLKKEEEELKKEVSSFLANINVMVNIENLKKYCEEDSENIKLVTNENPIDPSTMFIDISMNPKGIDEEKTYLAHPEYTTIIRRGNTVLEQYRYDNYKKDYQYQKSYMLRKGMKKFIDLPYDFFTVDETTKKYYLKTTSMDNIETANSLKYIFYPCIESNSKGYLIEIIKLMKANGENAQISYSDLLHSWVIASKNVCLCASKRKDLDDYFPPTRWDNKNKEYVPTRYSFANKIGHCWFDIIENFTPEEIKTIQDFIKDKTLIGEYVGNQFHQHLIRYMKHTILFFGIVENNNPTDNSLPVLKAFQILKKFKLDVVPFEYIGTYEKMEDLYEALKKLYVRIAESSIIDEEEGSVIYLNRTCARKLDSDQKYRKDDKVLSLCKLKTWEYRIYRKLREKLKNHLADENYYESSRRKISQFFEEIRVMLQGFNLPMPIEFYYKTAETAFDFVNYYKEKNILPDLHSSYIDFIETIHSIVDESVSLKSRVIQQDNIMTFDYLVKNSLKAQKTIEIIIYAPPCYLSDNFLKRLAQEFQTQIYNSFIPEDSYINVTYNVVIYHINMHNFRNISKLGKNKNIIAFGLNQEEIEKSKKMLRDKMLNALFKSYNTNKSLTPFLNSDNLDDLYKYYLNESVKFITKAKANFPDQVYLVDKFIEEKEPEYIRKINEIILETRKEIENINIDQIIKDSFYSDNKTLISIENDSQSRQKIKQSKYKNSNIIRIFEEHKNPYEDLKAEFLENQKKKYSVTSKIEVNNSDTSSSNVKQIIVLIPMTIPGNGKTFFINQLKPILDKHGISFHTISSDLIRRGIMDNIRKRDSRKSEQEAFRESGKSAGYAFENELKETFKKIYYDTTIKKAMIYIDKNHPTNAINRSTEPIRKFLQSNYDSSFKLDLQFVALIPDCRNDFEFMKNKTLSHIPFSLPYFIQCYLRVKHRMDHPTLNGDVKDLIGIFGIFIQNFINLKLNEDSIIMYQKLDKAIKLPFTDEIEEDQLPADLVKCGRDFFASLITNERGGNNNWSNRNVVTPIAERFEYMINKYFPKGNEFFPTKNLVSSTAEPIVAKLYGIQNFEIPKTTNFIYLGVLLQGEQFYVKFKSKISSSLKKVKETFSGSIEPEINELISSIEIVKGITLPSGWKYPHKMHKNLWHCTTLYKGNVSFDKVRNKVEYKEFIEGKEIPVKILGLIYVPKKIIVSIIKLEGASSVNEFTHVTTFINGYPPKKANEVMKEVFGEKGNPAIKKVYNDKMNNEINTSTKDFISMENIKIDEKNVKAYVVLYEQELELEGEMHAFEQ